MNWLDLICLVILVLFVIRGAIKGLFKEAFGLIGIFLGLIIAINRYEMLGEFIGGEFENIPPKIANLVAFALIFVSVALIFGLAGIILHKMAKFSLVRGVDRTGGFLLGVGEGILICSVILILLSISPLSEKMSKWTQGSTFAPYLTKVGPFVYDSVISITPGKAKKFMQKLGEIEKSLPQKK
jgi:membrane protein required for colicin V production